MKYRNRFIHYAGVILIGLGVIFAPPSFLTAGIAGAITSYLPISITVWLMFDVLLGRLFPKPAAPRVDFAKIRLMLFGAGIGVLATGILLRNSTATENGLFLLLVALEFHVTRNESVRQAKVG